MTDLNKVVRAFQDGERAFLLGLGKTAHKLTGDLAGWWLRGWQFQADKKGK